MNAERGHRLYDDLAGWWPLLSPPDDYGEEAEALLDYLERCGAPDRAACWNWAPVAGASPRT